jgi:hypothetical protein
MTNYPRFNQKSEERINDNVQNDENEKNKETERMNNLMSKTLEKINKLKEELKLLNEKKKEKIKINTRVNNNIIGKSKSQVVNKRSLPHKKQVKDNKFLLNSEDNVVHNIIEKYSFHKASDELAVFENMFRHYNQTTSNKVDVKEVNRKIQETMKTVNTGKYKKFKIAS